MTAVDDTVGVASGNTDKLHAITRPNSGPDLGKSRLFGSEEPHMPGVNAGLLDDQLHQPEPHTNAATVVRTDEPWDAEYATITLADTLSHHAIGFDPLRCSMSIVNLGPGNIALSRYPGTKVGAGNAITIASGASMNDIRHKQPIYLVTDTAQTMFTLTVERYAP